MNDADIIKTLECCIDCNCKECPCCKIIDGNERCKEMDEKEILDLINRQKGEIESLGISNLILTARIKRIASEARKDFTDLFHKVIETYGTEAQENMCIEECAELIQAINKKHRGMEHNIPEEIADVEVTLEQLKIINGCTALVERIKKEKVQRLAKTVCGRLYNV